MTKTWIEDYDPEEKLHFTYRLPDNKKLIFLRDVEVTSLHLTESDASLTDEDLAKICLFHSSDDVRVEGSKDYMDKLYETASETIDRPGLSNEDRDSLKNIVHALELELK